MRDIAVLTLLAITLAACGGGDSHPWLVVPEDASFELIEASGVGQGQIVIATEPTISREEALALGEQILAQAPEDATVNVRIYNDAATARNWSTVDAQWTNEHLLAVATRTRAGGDEVRYVGPEEDGGLTSDMITEPSTLAAPDTIS